MSSGGSPANGTYNLTFSLYNVGSGGSSVAGPVTTNGVVVTNGLFTVLIDFGSGMFTGQTNWLQIGVETNGDGGFTTLTPRQPVAPTPYAIYAETASATGLTGTIPAGNLGGTYGGALTFNNVGNNFTGNGSGLTLLNPSNISPGTAGINISGSAAGAVIVTGAQSNLIASALQSIPPGATNQFTTTNAALALAAQQIAASGMAINNPNGLTSAFIASLIQPGGLVVIGDSLSPWSCSNIFGGGTNYWAMAGSMAAPSPAVFSGGVNYFPIGENWTN